MKKPKELFLVWEGSEPEEEYGYFSQYFSLVDAVKSSEKGTLIYKASISCLGSFDVETKLVKTKKRKN